MSFDQLAPHYRLMEYILAGDKLQRCRTAFIDRIRSHKDILILGPGAGRFLVKLAAANTTGRITCLDSSSGMLQSTRELLLGKGLFSDRIELLHQDVLQWIPPRTRFDAIVAHFFLDCFTSAQLEDIVNRVSASAQSDALWLIADFNEPASGFSKWRARAILWTMYRFFRLITRLPADHLVSPDLLLRMKGFELRERRLADWNLLHTDLWQLTG
jgi:ubiquinone/menaquinone biosynthesis C-methylase UbiE